MEDLESGTVPVAVRLEPRFYAGKKAAGYTFLGPGSTELIREAFDERLAEKDPEAQLIPRSYYSIRVAIYQAKRIIALDPQIQPCHGFRTYFENALDDANVDHEKKMVIEGHFGGTRAKHYTDRDVEELREIYRTAYPFIQIDERVQPRTESESYRRRFADPEARLDKQRVLEAKLTVLEDELNQMKEFRKQIEQRKR